MSVHNSVVVITGCFTLVCVGWIMPYSWPIFCVCHTEVINRKKNRFAELLPIFLDCFFFVCRWADVFVVFFYRSSRGNTCWLRSQSTLNGMLMIDNNFVFSSFWSAIASYNLHRFLYVWYTLPLHAVCCFVLNFFYLTWRSKSKQNVELLTVPVLARHILTSKSIGDHVI